VETVREIEREDEGERTDIQVTKLHPQVAVRLTTGIERSRKEQRTRSATGHASTLHQRMYHAP